MRETGFYETTYMGVELSIRKISAATLREVGEGKTKSYRIFLNDLFVEKGWTVADSKAKAERLAEKVRRGESVPPYEEARKGQEQKRRPFRHQWSPDFASETLDASTRGHTGAVQYLGEQDDPVFDPEPEPEVQAVKALETAEPAETTSVGETHQLPAVAPVPEAVPDTGTAVSFTLTGSIQDSPSTAAVDAVQRAVDLLRRYGTVECRLDITL